MLFVRPVRILREEEEDQEDRGRCDGQPGPTVRKRAQIAAVARPRFGGRSHAHRFPQGVLRTPGRGGGLAHGPRELAALGRADRVQARGQFQVALEELSAAAAVGQPRFLEGLPRPRTSIQERIEPVFVVRPVIAQTVPSSRAGSPGRSSRSLRMPR